MSSFRNLIILTCISLLLALPTFCQNLKAEEIVVKHLDSIGSAEKCDSMKTLMAVGVSEFEARIPVIRGGGKAVIVSDPDNLFFVISLNSKEYPFEKIGYFKGKLSLPFIAAGSRSMLGLFINEHEKVLSEGLFGGTMSLRWALADAEKRKTTMKSGGTKKVAEQKAYVVDYYPAGIGSGDFKIRLFFDAETFRHIRSEYRREVVRGQGTFGQQSQQGNAVVQLIEDFADFRTIDGLTLPHSYKVTFASNSNTTSNENIWRINVAQYYFNQKLAPDFFTFDPK